MFLGARGQDGGGGKGGLGRVRVAALVRIALLGLIWGSSFLWIKLSLRSFSPMQMVFLRLLLGAAFLLVLVRAGGQRLPRGRAVWGHLFAVAAIGNVVPFFLFAFGERSVDTGLAGIMNATTPLW